MFIEHELSCWKNHWIASSKQFINSLSDFSATGDVVQTQLPAPGIVDRDQNPEELRGDPDQLHQQLLDGEHLASCQWPTS